jgi:hypothetical protein
MKFQQTKFQQANYVGGGRDIGFVAKMALRRYFLDKYHRNSEPMRVLDCCQGEGRIWGKLRTEYKLESYWGVDNDKVNRKAGRLVIDSRRILMQSGLEQNVYDIDTYGSPWRHWVALLENGPERMTVFLTYGRGGPVGGGWDSALLDTLNLRFKKLQPPDGLIAKITSAIGIPSILGRAVTYGWNVIECKEAFPQRTFKVEVGHGRKARYIGVRLERATS